LRIAPPGSSINGVLLLDDLHKRFGEVTALDGATLAAHPGRVLGFLGPNGAGKTTAMRSVFGLVALDAGRVTWEGREVTRDDRRRFGYMPEQRGLYPKMRVGEQLTWLARIHRIPAADASAAAGGWLDRLGLGGRAGDRLEQLSHGNQQRVQLAAALVHGPVLLVLDEPFSGLDPMGVDRMAEVIRERADAGTAVVFSSHQLDLVEDVCDDVVIIDRGRVVLAGSLRGLREESAVRRLEITIEGAGDWEPPVDGLVRLGRRDGSSAFLVPAGADPAVLLGDAERWGKVSRFTFEPPRLSDLFREAVAP
jgi:ABC-2 type transport system ATP-binding protein